MTEGSTRGDWTRNGGVIAVAMAVMNVTTYGYTMVAARLLGPGSYGAFAAVMGLLLVIGVLQLGLQTTGARRIAAQPESVAEVERALMRVTYGAAAVLALVCLLLSPLVDRLLHLGSLPTAVLVAFTALPMTVMGGQAGVLQGERRWRALAALYLAAGVPRLLLGGALLAWRPTETMAVLAVTVAFVAPVVVGWWALRRSAPGRSQAATGLHDERSILAETFRNSHALLAFFALSNADVIIARDVLGGHESGLYAGGLILVKAVLFLPQFVVVVAFPSMSDGRSRGRALAGSVGVVLVLGVVSTLGALVLSGLALVFVGGPEYAEIQDRLWLFAILGTVLSVVQLLVYSVVARQSRRSVYLLWGGLVALVLATRAVDDATSLALVVVAVDAVVMLALLATSVHGLRGSRTVVREDARVG
ncbi:Membrane protein involved in the export of O-antigen and teichoic acid [Nocardioides scoriae]|uniref:Membrane protein involved in the export of O-antigen and teichoic acid n=1 Tax=Nocardioides scoriae TaxID=642780 RepID=A0A1H1QI31_9ACTN|nr:oligosaccharide flippase family protein [Nocardioides scoriae]SDS22977.1 Membrane protein involved in the export of O-antigen and teichoic acid [Nocardioides scoriae]